MELRTTGRMLQSHLLFGVGPGQWQLRYPAFIRPGQVVASEDVPVGDLPTGDWAGVAAERGMAGVAALFAAFIVLGTMVLKAFRIQSDVAGALVALATLAAISVMGGWIWSSLTLPQGWSPSRHWG